MSLLNFSTWTDSSKQFFFKNLRAQISKQSIRAFTVLSAFGFLSHGAMAQTNGETNQTQPLIWILLVIVAAFLGFGGRNWLIARNRKREEAILRQAQQSEAMAIEANKAKSVFMAHMSHELRTPLNAIIGFSELIAEELDETSDSPNYQKLHSDLDKIKSSAYYQLSLVNNLLDLTEIESKKSKLFLQDFSIREMVERVIHQMNAMLHLNKNQLEVFFEPKDPGSMRADVKKLEGILVNILTNANKFTSEGMITLRVQIDTESKPHQVAFTIRDTGMGIKTEHMRTLFEEFTQMVDQTRYGGTGLGLNVSKRFCKMMGGRITVSSTYGEGSTFTIRVPKTVPDTEDSLTSKEYPLYRPRRVKGS